MPRNPELYEETLPPLPATQGEIGDGMKLKAYRSVLHNSVVMVLEVPAARVQISVSEEAAELTGGNVAAMRLLEAHINNLADSHPDLRDVCDRAIRKMTQKANRVWVCQQDDVKCGSQSVVRWHADHGDCGYELMPSGAGATINLPKGGAAHIDGIALMSGTSIVAHNSIYSSSMVREGDTFKLSDIEWDLSVT